MPSLSRSQRRAYGVADLGLALAFTVVNTWLLYFLVNVVGLPPLLAGVVFVLGRLFDALLDPVMGAWSDRLRLRVGRLAFVRWGVAPLALTFIVLWWLPVLPASQAARFAVALAVFCVHSAAFTVVAMPWLALAPELSSDYDEQTSLNGTRMSFAVVGILLAVALPPVIVATVTGTSELASADRSGWLVMAAALGVVVTAAPLLTGVVVREPGRGGQAPAAPTRLSVSLRSALPARGFATVFSCFVAITVAIMVVNSILPFFLESVSGIAAETQTVLLGATFLTAILSFPAWSGLSRRLGKRGSLLVGLGVYAAGLLALVLAPSGAVGPVLLTAVLLTGLGLAALLLFPWAMLPDVIGLDGLTGPRREGVFYAIFTFGQKVAGSLGVFASALVTAVFGYVQGTAEQSAQTVLGLRIAIGPVAMAGLAIAAALVWRYPLSRTTHTDAQAGAAALTPPDAPVVPRA